uniref:CCHC-type domain-containing protein n=1 Tax=Rhodnius prolixus TaxID=13249 RepID=T1HK66_RHOPR
MQLGNIKRIESAILCAPVEKVKRFYEIIFGLNEGRLSRKKIKEFEGFKLNDVDLVNKVEELKDTFSLWELKSVANLLGIQLSCRQDVASELCKFLNDISLLFEATNEEQLDEEEDEYFEEVSGNSTSSKYVQQCRPCQFSSRDIEESLRPFTGEDNYTVNLWLTDFEELAQVMKWQELEKLVFAKISLKGLAKLFVYGERGLTSYSALKEALVEEFSNEDSVKENCLRLNKIDSKVASRKCFNCYEEGHLVAECPKPRREKGSCFECGKMGHLQRDCQRQKQSTPSLVSLVVENSAVPPSTADIVIEGATSSGEVVALPGSAISLIMEDRVSEDDVLHEVALKDGSELILSDHSAVEQKPFPIVNPELNMNDVKSVPKIISECIPTEKPSEPVVDFKVDIKVIRESQNSDKGIGEIHGYLEDKVLKGFELCKGLVFRREKGKILFVVPGKIESQIVSKCHDYIGHLGVNKGAELILRSFGFAKLQDKIKDYIDSCIKCNAYNPILGKKEMWWTMFCSMLGTCLGVYQVTQIPFDGISGSGRIRPSLVIPVLRCSRFYLNE